MATVTKGRTFVSGETVTPTKLNDLVDQATVTSIVDADVSASAAIALSKLATGALPTAITTTTGNIVDASVTPAKLSQPYTLATAQASTSGTSIDFTGIPSWAKRVTVLFDGVSTNGSSMPIIQLGDSGGVETSGYIAGASDYPSYEPRTAGIPIARSWANTFIVSGSVTLSLVDTSSNTWVASGNLNDAGGFAVYSVGGKKAISATLDRVRITTLTGADAFDAGSINIAYEG